MPHPAACARGRSPSGRWGWRWALRPSPRVMIDARRPPRARPRRRPRPEPARAPRLPSPLSRPAPAARSTRARQRARRPSTSPASTSPASGSGTTAQPLPSTGAGGPGSRSTQSFSRWRSRRWPRATFRRRRSCSSTRRPGRSSCTRAASKTDRCAISRSRRGPPRRACSDRHRLGARRRRRHGAGDAQCYAGGEERILASDLVDNPARDRWCVTLGGAMGRSVNAVFARLASKHLEPEHARARGRTLRLRSARALRVRAPRRARCASRRGAWGSHARRRASGTRRCRPCTPPGSARPSSAGVSRCGRTSCARSLRAMAPCGTPLRASRRMRPSSPRARPPH